MTSSSQPCLRGADSEISFPTSSRLKGKSRCILVTSLARGSTTKYKAREPQQNPVLVFSITLTQKRVRPLPLRLDKKECVTPSAAEILVRAGWLGNCDWILGRGLRGGPGRPPFGCWREGGGGGGGERDELHCIHGHFPKREGEGEIETGGRRVQRTRGGVQMGRF